MDSSEQTGVGNHSLELIKQLKRQPENFSLSVYGQLPDTFEPNLEIKPRSVSNPLLRAYADLWQVGRWADSKKLDLLHCPKSIAPLACFTPTSITIHDLIFMKYPETYSFFWKTYWKTVLKLSIKRAERIVSVSESTKSDLTSIWDVEEEKIEVIPNGVDLDRFRPETNSRNDGKIRDRYNLPPTYWFYLGHFFPRKNLGRLVSAYSSLDKTHDLPPLVLAGPNNGRDQALLEQTENSGTRSKLHFPGYIEYKDLPGMYRNSRALIYPSLDEGFGLPILEAMACGTHIACSDVQALREVGHDYPMYFNPTSTEDIELTLKNLLDVQSASRNPPDRVDEYSWENIGEKYKKFFSQLF